jgi:tripartite-type tricarboxylate transporter receptor subunit TctC
MSIARRSFLHASAAALVSGLAARAFAQAAPLDTVRIVTGFAPGGTADAISRRVASKLAPGYGKTVVVENRVGAGGRIAVQSYKNLPYDPLEDVMPVSLGATFDFGFAVGPAVPARVTHIAEFLAWCKANPTQANFGSPGAGAVPHFIGVLIGRSGGVALRHVPYRGTQPAILEMVGGQLQAVSGPVGEFTPHVAAGKCRVLASTGRQRSKFAPNVPTLLEQGLKDMAFNEWFGFFLPAKAEPDVVQRANAALRAALAEREVIEGLELMGMEAKSSTPDELGAMLKADTARWGPLVKAVGFTAES